MLQIVFIALILAFGSTNAAECTPEQSAAGSAALILASGPGMQCLAAVGEQPAGEELCSVESCQQTYEAAKDIPQCEVGDMDLISSLNPKLGGFFKLYVNSCLSAVEPTPETPATASPMPTVETPAPAVDAPAADNPTEAPTPADAIVTEAPEAETPTPEPTSSAVTATASLLMVTVLAVFFC